MKKAIAAFGLSVLLAAVSMVAPILAQPRPLDNAPCFHPMGSGLHACRIYHEPDGRLAIIFQNPVLNAWFQFEGDGKVWTWFDRNDIGNYKRAVLWRFDATEAMPFPGKGISTSPGYVAVAIEGTLMEPSGIEDIVYQP